MKLTDKYLEALKTIDDWATVSEWAKHFGELYPDLLAKAEQEALHQANETTGLRELAARISSGISRGAYDQEIEVDTSEKPRKVRFIPEAERINHESQEIEEDVAPLRRDEIVKLALNEMSVHDRYRVNEFEMISKQLKQFFGLDFEVDHAHALLNITEPGQHHPDNFQLLLKAHNSRKNNSNWKRFSIDEQVEYITTAIQFQKIVASKFEIDIEPSILDSLIIRLTNIY